MSDEPSLRGSQRELGGVSDESRIYFVRFSLSLVTGDLSLLR